MIQNIVFHFVSLSGSGDMDGMNKVNSVTMQIVFALRV